MEISTFSFSLLLFILIKINTVKPYFLKLNWTMAKLQDIKEFEILVEIHKDTVLGTST